VIDLLDPATTIRSLFNAGEYEKMYNYCRKILDDYPDDMTALQNITLALTNLGRYEEALTYCDAVLKVWDEDPYALRSRLVIMESLKRYDDVVDTCGRILRSPPKTVWHPTAWDWP